MTTYTWQIEKGTPPDTLIGDVTGATGTIDITPPGSGSDPYTIPGDDSLAGLVIRARVSDGITTHYSPWSPTVEPAGTPPPAGTIYFDGRATRMTALSSHETTPGDLSTLVEVDTPKEVWQGHLAFLNDDIKLVADTRYGQIYDITVGLNSHNPYYTPSDGRSAELSTIRPLALGSWDWYANAYKIKSPFSQPDWCVVDQFGYPSLWSPPLAIHADGSNFVLAQYAGRLTLQANGSYRGTLVQNTVIVANPLDTWVEIITGVKWSTSQDGEIHVYYRIPSGDNVWHNPLNFSGIDTEQWGTTPSGSYPQNYLDGAGNPLNVTDHGGLYFGFWNAPPLPSPFPTNRAQRMGPTRSSDLDTAKSTLPA